MKESDIIGHLSPENLDGDILSFDFNPPASSSLFKNNKDNFLYKEDLNTEQIKFILYLCYNNYLEIFQNSFCYLEGESFIENVGETRRISELVGILKNDSGLIEKVIFMHEKYNK